MKKTLDCMLYLLIGIALIMTSPTTVSAQEITSWRFDKDPSGWTSPASIKFKILDLPNAGGKVLFIQGSTKGGTVLSSPWPGENIKAGAIIRVTARMNIPVCNSNVYLKIYALDKDRKHQINIMSNAYDAVKSGSWQRLMAELKVPETASWTTYVTVVHEADGKIDMYLDDLAIKYADKIQPLGPFADSSVPSALKRLSGVHPRLFISKVGVAELRKKIHTAPYNMFWMKLKNGADAAKQPETTFPACNLANRQRDYGYLLPKLAFAWLLTRDARYLETAVNIATAMANAPSWGACAATDKDHVAGVVLFGLSVFYDWCYEGISPSLKRQILNKINSVSSTMASRLISGAHADPWWKNAYLCNQMPVGIAGLTAAGFATFDELEDAPAWLHLSKNKIENTLAVRADDGAYIEGVGYWGYDLDSLLKSVYLFSELLGTPLYESAWLKNTGMYRLYMGLPRHSWTRANQVVDFDDSIRANWYGPDTLLRGLAANYRNPYLQWLANEVDQHRFTNDTSEWLNLIWYDASLKPEKPDTLPTFRHFNDLDIVSTRSDWSGNESLLVYTAGSPVGQKAMRMPASGKLFAEHMHPDAGHFILFAGGDWLLRDDGYWDDTGKENPKKTENHNTLVIEGYDQLSAKEIFEKKAKTSVTGTYTSPGFDLIQSDLTHAYRPELGLSKFKRTLIFVKPDILIVLDDISLSAQRNLTLLFHTQSPVEEKDGAWIVKGENSVFRIDYFPKEGVQKFAGNMLYSNRRLNMPTMRIDKKTSMWKNATVFTWAGKGRTAPVIQAEQSGNQWLFKTSSKNINFNWDKHAVSITNMDGKAIK